MHATIYLLLLTQKIHIDVPPLGTEFMVTEDGEYMLLEDDLTKMNTETG